MSAQPAPLSDIRADVVVIGTGLIGATLAVALASAGVSVVAIDRLSSSAMTDMRFDGRTTAIAWGARRALSCIGVWEALAPRAEPILDIRISDGRLAPDRAIAATSLLHLHFDHREAGEAATRPPAMGYIVENRHMRLALFQRLAALPLAALLAPATIARVERGEHGVEATLGDGRVVRAALVVSAEGRGGGGLRESAKIKVGGWGYDQTAIVCVAGHERPHRGVAQEKFLPGGPFAILPMTDEEAGTHRSSIVWSERSDLAMALLALDDASFAREFAARFGDHLGAVAPVGPRFHHPLALSQAERYVDRRLALVGDAAHAIHPIAGQGWNLGLRDVAALAEVVVDAKRLGLDIGGANTLEAYESWRRVDNLALLAATDALNRLFSNDIPPVRVLRDLGLAAVNQVAPLRRFFMRHAMGMVGDLPKLVRGEPL